MNAIKHKRFSKADIQFHRDNPARHSHPAVNVKVRRFPTVSMVQEEWPGTDEKTAEKALEFVLENACDLFWEDYTDAENFSFYFPNYPNIKVYSEGRSSGWLVVHGLPEVSEWDAILVSAWGRFVQSIEKDITYRCSWEAVKEGIEANAYYKPLSTRFNHCDTDSGTVLLPDARADVLAYASKKYDGAATPIIRGI